MWKVEHSRAEGWAPDGAKTLTELGSFHNSTREPEAPENSEAKHTATSSAAKHGIRCVIRNSPCQGRLRSGARTRFCADQPLQL